MCTKSPAVGIDLGTTFSVVAVCHGDGKVEIIPNKQGNRTTPSSIAFTNNKVLVGENAVAQAVDNPENTIYGIKRLMGRSIKEQSIKIDIDSWPFKVIEEENKLKIQVIYQNEIQKYYPEQISAIMLEKLKKTAEDYLHCTIQDVVITVPAYFNDAQRRATLDAAKIAGLNVLRIINEPTAAALAFGHKTNEVVGERNVLVYDFGGGTFDVSIVTINGLKYKVRAITGDTHLGGEDIDDRLVEHFADEFEEAGSLDIRSDPKLMRMLKNYCEESKRLLSSVTKASFQLDGIDHVASITKAKFEQLNMDIFERTIELVDNVLEKAGIPKNQIHDVVLVGGSSRIPYVREMLKNYFNINELNRIVNPDEAVAYGAAIQAAILGSNPNESMKHIKLRDVCPFSLGVETMNGKMTVVVPRNSSIPIKKKKTFRTVDDNQDLIHTAIYEGDNFLAKDNYFLGEFFIENIPLLPAGFVKEKCIFEIDSDGILTVTGFEPRTENIVKIVIKNESRLSNEEAEFLVEKAKAFKIFDDTIAEAEQDSLTNYEYDNVNGIVEV